MLDELGVSRTRLYTADEPATINSSASSLRICRGLRTKSEMRLRVGGRAMRGSGSRPKRSTGACMCAASSTVDGQRLEGAGVAPDHSVPAPLAYAAGADPRLGAEARVFRGMPSRTDLRRRRSEGPDCLSPSSLVTAQQAAVFSKTAVRDQRGGGAARAHFTFTECCVLRECPASRESQ